MRKELEIVEKAKRLIKDPVDYGKIERKQNAKNDLIRSYMKGEIGLDFFREELAYLEEELGNIPSIVFSNPWSLYGLLRRLGLDRVSTVEVVVEERDHFLEAARAQLSPRVMVIIGRRNKEEESARVFGFFVSYQIPQDRNPDDIREYIRNISLAPATPSSDDLAKLSDDDLFSTIHEIGNTHFLHLTIS